MPKGTKLVISCVTPTGESAATAHLGEQHISTSAVGSSVDNPETNFSRLESFVLAEAASSHISTPAGIDTADSIMNTVSSSSDNVSTVVDILSKFVEIGDAIAEASVLFFTGVLKLTCF
jgi:hypothetical protein